MVLGSIRIYLVWWLSRKISIYSYINHMEISSESCFFFIRSLFNTYNCYLSETELCHLVEQLHRPVEKCWHQITWALPVTTPLQTTYVCLWHRHRRAEKCCLIYSPDISAHTMASPGRAPCPGMETSELHSRVWTRQKATSMSKMSLNLICFFLRALIAPSLTGK